jgi:hypothetical protein
MGLFTDIKDASAVLAQILGIAGLVWMLFFSFCEKNRSSIVKLIGSALVLALAFAANNAFTYGLAIFIVATLVTDLDFLEKLAAFFWNRDKYWEYQLKKQSPDAAEAKAAKEANEILSEKTGDSHSVPEVDVIVEPCVEPVGRTDTDIGSAAEAGEESTSGSKGNPFIRKALMTGRILNFESQVAQLITSEQGPFAGGAASTNFLLEGRDRNYEIDLIIRVPGTHYVAEVKYGVTPQIVKAGEMRAREVARVYESHLREKGFSNVIVIPLLIVSSKADCTRLGRGINVVRFNEKTKSFDWVQ